MNRLEHFKQRYPFAFWAYLALLSLFVIDASLFSSVTISVRPVNGVLLGLLILGLLAGIRVCRWMLIAISVITALGILLIQAGSGNFADALLVIIPLGQVGALFSPSMRAFTAPRAKGLT